MEKPGQCDAQNVLDIISATLEKDQHANGGVMVDEEDNLAALFYHCENMVNLSQKFSEILFIDGTYNVNTKGRNSTVLLHH